LPNVNILRSYTNILTLISFIKARIVSLAHV
jgi:hypothetical protein